LQKMLFDNSGLVESDESEKIAIATLVELLNFMQNARIWNNDRAALAAYESYVLSFPVVVDGVRDSDDLRFREFNKVKGPLLRSGISAKCITLDNNDNLTFFCTKENPITLSDFIEIAKDFFDMMIKSKTEE